MEGGASPPERLWRCDSLRMRRQWWPLLVFRGVRGGAGGEGESQGSRGRSEVTPGGEGENTHSCVTTCFQTHILVQWLNS